MALSGAAPTARDQARNPVLRALLVLLALGLAVAASAITVLTGGVVRADLVVLATILREVRSVPVRVASVVVAAATAFVYAGAAPLTGGKILVSLAEAVAVAAVLAFTPRRAGASAAPGHRFAVVTVWLMLVVVVGALVEALGTATPVHGSFAEHYFARMLPLLVAVFLAAAVAARPTVASADAPGRPSMLAKLAGPFVVLVLSSAAAQITLAYWAEADESTLQTAADTAAASFQQAVTADIDAFIARANTAPAKPWDVEDNFSQSMQAFVGGNASVSAVAYLTLDGSTPTAVYVISRQGVSPELGPTMGASAGDASSLTTAVTTGSAVLLGVRQVPAADATPEAALVFVNVQTLATPPKNPALLSMAVSLPTTFTEAAAGLGPLQSEVVLRLVDAATSGDKALASVVPEDAVYDDNAERASAEASFGTTTLRIEALATEALGPSFGVRTAVLLGLAGFALVALLLVLQAANAGYRSQNELEEREALLATALAAAPGLVALIDADGHVRVLNSGPDGQMTSDAVGRHVGYVLPFTMPADDRDRFNGLLEACVEGVGGSMEYVDIATEESLRIWLITANPVPQRTGGAVRALVQVQDVTEQRARAVRGAQAQRLQALGTMAGGLAHDFNNLLFIITGYLQMLEEDERVTSQPDLVRYVERAVDAAGRGTEIASSLLAVSRSQPLQATLLDVSKFISDMLPLVRQAVGTQREVVFTGDGHHQVLVDSGQLSSAVLNLVINSRDATQPGGRVEVAVNQRMVNDDDLGIRPGEYVVVEVRDDGAGMTPEAGARAFEPFFSTKSTGNGTGLGLTAVYSFASQSGGIATISSEPDRGTVVSMYLPLAAEEHDGGDVIAVDGLDGPTRVLVVDDESALAGLVAAWVGETGATVKVADSPHEALRVAESFRPDVLLTDIRLGDPEMDGIGLASRVSAVLPGVTVILMTGYSDRMNEAHAVGSRVLAKPFTKDELHRVLESTGDLVTGRTEGSR